MRRLLFGKDAPSTHESEKKDTVKGAAKSQRTKVCRVLVIDGDTSHDWENVFAGSTVTLKKKSCETASKNENGDSDEDILTERRDVVAIQAGWRYIRVASYASDHKGRPDLQLTVRTTKERKVSFRPDFVLIRNECRGTSCRDDFRHVLFTMMHAGIPSVNSLESIFGCLERPVVHGALVKLQRKLGRDCFPLIDQTAYATSRDMFIAPAFPNVVKVGHAHAGQGKMLLNSHKEFEDLKSVVSIADTYCTAESFIKGAYDLRIQKIGQHYRALKRVSVSGNWKTNVGTSTLEDLPMTAQYKKWADAASTLFGGLDICTVDAIHCAKSGREFILEVNGTSSGLAPEHAAEDTRYIRDLVLERIAAEVPCSGWW